jgi:hypothetical protein
MKASIRAASLWTTAMSFRDFDNPIDINSLSSIDIAAEATSEFARGPSYEELWLEPRRPAREASAAQRSRLPLIFAIISVIIGAMALIGLRERIVRVAPLSAAFYSTIGLPVNLAGLELRSLRSQIVMDGARKVLTIEGEIVNLRREANRVPPMALTVRGENGLDKYAWTEPAPKARLAPGEIIAFRARLASPPPDGADVLVRFAKAEPKRSLTKTRAPSL